MPVGKVHTFPKVDSLDVEWRIKPFLALSDGKLYSSPQFSFNAHTWHLGIRKTDSVIMLFLGRSSLGPTISQDFSLAFKTRTGRKVSEMHCSHDFLTEDYRLLLQAFVYINDILVRKLASPKTLTLMCTMKMPTFASNHNGGNVSNNAAAQIIGNSTPPPRSNIAVKILRKRKAVTKSISGRSVKLLNDLKEMMLSGDHSDITIKVKGEDFKLHRGILSARNSYFHAMFKTDMLEKITGIVSIEDCEPHIFRSFIHFIYTGKVDKISLENICDLYEMADKYQEDELKKKCLYFMMDNISVDNFCDFTALALKYDEKKLLETATNFFCIRVKQIIQCEKWQVFLKEYSTQANELYIKAIDRFDDDIVVCDNFDDDMIVCHDYFQRVSSTSK